MKAKTKTQAQAIATAATAATQQMHQNEPWLSMNGEYGRTRATTRNPFGLSLSRMAFSSVHGNSHLQQNPWRRKGVRRKRKKKFEKAKRIESRLDRTSKMMPLQKKTTSPPPLLSPSPQSHSHLSRTLKHVMTSKLYGVCIQDSSL